MLKAFVTIVAERVYLIESNLSDSFKFSKRLHLGFCSFQFLTVNSKSNWLKIYLSLKFLCLQSDSKQMQWLWR